MRSSRRFAASFIAAALVLAGCANRPEPETGAELSALAFAPELPAANDFANPELRLAFPGLQSGLAGRSIKVDDISDLVLARKEVVLTFDDGPLPGKTKAILDTLDRRGVKATFLMVGQMANSYPDLVREVARRGHTVGTHTQGHPNLASMDFDSAVSEIERGQRSVAAALAPAGEQPAPFFRFPYLADTARLRHHLAMQGVVVVHPTVDSKDYFVSTPDQVRRRTLRKLDQAGSGIILFHDLHQRTVAMLPAFLDDLEARGYKVVHLVPETPAVERLLVAALSE